MTQSRKFFNLMLAGASLLATLSGCSSAEEPTSPGSPSSLPAEDTTAAAEVLRVGIDLKYYPFMYEDASGNPAGLEPAVSYEFGEFLGMDVEIVNTDFSMLLPALDTGNIDIIISDMSSNESRMEKADFSEPYRYGHTLALVNQDFATEHNITDDMSKEDFFAIESARYVGLSGTIAVTIPQERGIEVDEVTDVSLAVVDISRGNYDVIVGADTIRGDQAAHSDTTMIYNGINEPLGSRFVVKKGNTELLEQANLFIETLYEEGGLYEEIGTSMDKEIGEFLQDDTLGLSYIVTP